MWKCRVESATTDGVGVISEIKAANPEMMADFTIKRWHDMMASSPDEAYKAVLELIKAQSNKRLPPVIMDPKFAKSVRERNTAIAEKFNEPGRFTAFIGDGWTSNAGGGDNLHRNVVYRDDKDKADRGLPMTTFQSENPEDLWKWMAEGEKATGGKLLAIPRNGNLSNGRMFALSTFAGDSMTKRGPTSARGGSHSSRPSRSKARASRTPRCRRPTSSR